MLIEEEKRELQNALPVETCSSLWFNFIYFYLVTEAQERKNIRSVEAQTDLTIAGNSFYALVNLK